jgi:cyclophilin family peptidyl-prolyl cis-trans isomerase
MSECSDTMARLSGPPRSARRRQGQESAVFVKKPMLFAAGAGLTVLATALSATISIAAVGASPKAKLSTSVLLPTAAAKQAGFATVVDAPSSSSATGIAGCPDGAQEEFSGGSGTTGLVAEVLYCTSNAAAKALLESSKTSGKAQPGLNPPKALGSSAIERVRTDSVYLIVWQRGNALEFVGLSTDISASSSTSTTSGTAVPITTHQQQALANAAVQQNARFKLVSVSSGSSTSAADAKAQSSADAASSAAGCPSSPKTKLKKPSWSSAPAMTIDPTKTYKATVKTDVGTFVIALDAKAAPKTVNNFVFLAEHGFFNCVIFHRVIPGFMDQTGDPTGTGSGGPGYTIPDELPAAASNAADQYPLGSVAMANTGSPNTGGSQWFIVAGPEGEGLANSYALFGQVTSGMKVVEKINAQGSAAGVPPDVTHRMLKVTITSS